MFSANTTQVSSSALYVEDVFSTYLYTGNGGSQTITNGIDLAGQGGLVWIKSRSNAVTHNLQDTVRGANKIISSNSTAAQYDGGPAGVNFAFNSSGFSQNNAFTDFNANGVTFASWTFRKAPKFFDVVTYTGTGSATTIAHNLGIAPGCVIIKRTDTTGDWFVWHQNATQQNSYAAKLNTTGAYADTGTQLWGAPTTGFPSMTATTFSIGGSNNTNASGGTYVAYLFAHDTSSTGFIQCGSYTVGGTYNVSINLGWEPQWVLTKRTSGTSDWYLNDVMRGAATDVSPWNSQLLFPNTSAAETTTNGGMIPTATGFDVKNAYDLGTYIYIAIRRGPMKTPTLGTSVFSPVLNTGNNTAKTLTTNFVTDLTVSQGRNAGSGSRATWWDRLRGPLLGLQSLNTSAETSYTATLTGFDNNTGVVVGVDTTYGYINNAPDNFATWQFRRAPSFFDEVCYTGIASTRTVNHNLGVAPELIIVKNRTTGGTAWPAWASPFSGTNNSLYLNTTDAKSATGLFTTTPPTSTVFTVGNDSWINDAGYNYVAYLFASCPGVSKVGSYTGTGALQTINCGFTTGARFVLIKRTDSTGDWYVWDSARGITSGNDPYLLWNSNAVEVTSTNYVDTDTTGFQVTAAAPAGINASGGTYIFLAVA